MDSKRHITPRRNDGDDFELSIWYGGVARVRARRRCVRKETAGSDTDSATTAASGEADDDTTAAPGTDAAPASGPNRAG